MSQINGGATAQLKHQEPTTLLGLVVFLVRQYGMAVLSLVYLVVIVVSIAFVLRYLEPIAQAMHGMAERNAEAAEAQLATRKIDLEILGATREVLNATRGLAETVLRAAERVERIDTSRRAGWP